MVPRPPGFPIGIPFIGRGIGPKQSEVGFPSSSYVVTIPCLMSAPNAPPMDLLSSEDFDEASASDVPGSGRLIRIRVSFHDSSLKADAALVDADDLAASSLLLSVILSDIVLLPKMLNFLMLIMNPGSKISAT